MWSRSDNAKPPIESSDYICQRPKTIRVSEDAGEVHHSRTYICSNVVCHKSPCTRHVKTELHVGTFTRCSSSLDTSALSTRRSLTQPFPATRTSLPRRICSWP